MKSPENMQELKLWKKSQPLILFSLVDEPPDIDISSPKECIPECIDIGVAQINLDEAFKTVSNGPIEYNLLIRSAIGNIEMGTLGITLKGLHGFAQFYQSV